MKRVLAITAAGLVILAACGGSDKPAPEAEVKKDGPLAQDENSAGFNSGFSAFLNSYYSLKDAFVQTNTGMAASAATTLAGKADSLNLKDLKADTSIIQMATGYVQSISAEAKALAKLTDVEAQRKSFQTISEAMYDLIRTVRYDNEKVYQLHCPMAFNDAGANWLSRSSDIQNPYFGKKMLTCGEVVDSLDFKSK